MKVPLFLEKFKAIFRKMEKREKIEIIARAVVIQDGKILLCKVKTKDNWFFPGGHVETGETVTEGLMREFEEEIKTRTKRASFIGINENKFIFENEIHQELNVVFEVSLDESEVKCCEDHLEFDWFDLEKAKEMLVLPLGMKKAVFEWLEDGKIFYCYQ